MLLFCLVDVDLSSRNLAPHFSALIVSFKPLHILEPLPKEIYFSAVAPFGVSL